ncbi:MAG: quinone-dependent dihydroorotate dehydrogenase [Burkholderiales bacterium]|jgi:dihydroorotate dehydrogenase|nr:quinone-dependent dihydroorotate dehydrogenase [Burkholderiales bacterium]
MNWGLARDLLFRLDGERSHDLALRAARVAASMRLLPAPASRPGRSVRCMGIDFPNPVGLAAGLDKNGTCLDALGSFGFGFLEIGTVTPRPQPGNPKPRMFRLPEAQAVINRMGFNNDGVDALVRNVAAARWRGVLGVNIGKNATTPIDDAARDYVTCLDAVHAIAHWVTVNISSPNTQQLRALQGGDALARLLDAVMGRRAQLASIHGRQLPIAVKLAPDLDPDAIDAAAAMLVAHDVDAVIATNTTVARDTVAHLPHGGETGGLSGAPVRAAADRVLAHLRAALPPHLPLIGVGGILAPEHAHAKFAAGASLVQVYTGLVYRGPGLVRELVDATR